MPASHNQDGFFELDANDIVDTAPQVFVRDAGSGTVWGSVLRRAADQVHGEQRQAVDQDDDAGRDLKITGTGDAEVFATDFSGNTSAPVACRGAAAAELISGSRVSEGRRATARRPRSRPRSGERRNSFSIFFTSMPAGPSPTSGTAGDRSPRSRTRRGPGPGDRGELGDDVLALPALLEHPQHAVELARARLMRLMTAVMSFGSSSTSSLLVQGGQGPRSARCAPRPRPR